MPKRKKQWLYFFQSSPKQRTSEIWPKKLLSDDEALQSHSWLLPAGLRIFARKYQPITGTARISVNPAWTKWSSELLRKSRNYTLDNKSVNQWMFFAFKSNSLLQLAVCLFDCIMAEFSQMILYGREVCVYYQLNLYISEYNCYLFSAQQLPFASEKN